MNQGFKNKWVHYGMLGAIYSLGVVTLFSHTLFHGTVLGSLPEKCNQIGRTHQVIIQNSQFSPSLVKANLCDQLVFINQDQDIHQPAIGTHPFHFNYPLFSEKPLKKGESNILLVSLTGRYSFHDHLNNLASGILEAGGKNTPN